MNIKTVRKAPKGKKKLKATRQKQGREVENQIKDLRALTKGKEAVLHLMNKIGIGNLKYRTIISILTSKKEKSLESFAKTILATKSGFEEVIDILKDIKSSLKDLKKDELEIFKKALAKNPSKKDLNKAFKLALKHKWEPMCEKLLQVDKGNNLNHEYADEWGRTFLHLAAKEGYTKVVRLFIKKGAEVNKQVEGDEGRSPMHWAVENKKPEMIRLLLKAGADINAQDEDGNTPIHYAIQNNAPGIVKLLLILGANKQIANAEGQTALQLAEEELSEVKGENKKACEACLKLLKEAVST